MKQSIIIITFFLAGQIFAQNELKSDQIAKEIQLLELENNKLILNHYIAEQNDSTVCIPVFGISHTLVTNFQNNHPEIKAMRNKYDLVRKQQDSIKQKDAEYVKLNKLYLQSSYAEKKKLEEKFNQINNRLISDNPKFKDLVEKGRRLLNSTNYAILVEMTKEYQLKGEILPTSFIPYNDLARYKNDILIKKNIEKIQILNSLYRNLLEQELRLKYNLNDSTKLENKSPKTT